jgi:carnitine O-palmitoyltransferase 2
MYLSDRAPLPINYNPQIALNDTAATAAWPQAVKASVLVAGALRVARSLRDHVLLPDIFHTKPEQSDTARFYNLIRWVPSSLSFYGAYMMGGAPAPKPSSSSRAHLTPASWTAYPLDMSQYARLFASTRIPSRGKDVLQSWPDARHITVLRCARAFARLRDYHAGLTPKPPVAIGAVTCTSWTCSMRTAPHCPRAISSPACASSWTTAPRPTRSPLAYAREERRRGHGFLSHTHSLSLSLCVCVCVSHRP